MRDSPSLGMFPGPRQAQPCSGRGSALFFPWISPTERATSGLVGTGWAAPGCLSALTAERGAQCPQLKDGFKQL